MSSDQMSYSERLEMAERALHEMADDAGVTGFRVTSRIQTSASGGWVLCVAMDDPASGFRRMFPSHCTVRETDQFDFLTSSVLGCKVNCTAISIRSIKYRETSSADAV